MAYPGDKTSNVGGRRARWRRVVRLSSPPTSTYKYHTSISHSTARVRSFSLVSGALGGGSIDQCVIIKRGGWRGSGWRMTTKRNVGGSNNVASLILYA